MPLGQTRPPHHHRTHFARRLLDDTDLTVTVTDIAWASGFGSLRPLRLWLSEPGG